MSNTAGKFSLGMYKAVFIVSAALLVPMSWLPKLALASDATNIPLIAERWQAGGDVAFENDRNKQAILVVKKGYAELKGTYFSNGTIEFDVKFVARRITGITFRQRGETADALYFRPSPNCAVSDDCMQYEAANGHVFEWDLYGQYETHAPIKFDDWNHIKLVVSGARMNVFVNGASEPTLVVGALVGGHSNGLIRLHGPASYAHLNIAPNKTAGLSSRISSALAKRDRRYIGQWLASRPFVMPTRVDAALEGETGIDPVYLSIPADSPAWTRMTPEPGGLINLTRVFGAVQTGPSIAGIWLKTTIVSDSDQIKHVDIGWVREIWIFLNSKLIYANKNLYGVTGASKEPDGRLSLLNGSFDLPLRKGHNQLVVVLDDNHGGGVQHAGWGLQMRLRDVKGISQTGYRLQSANSVTRPAFASAKTATSTAALSPAISRRTTRILACIAEGKT